MDRNFRQEAPRTQTHEQTKSGAWQFAQAILDRPLPLPTTKATPAAVDREQLEWLASFSTEHEEQLRKLDSLEAESRREREQLEWVAEISTEHEARLRNILAAEAEARQRQARQSSDETPNLQEADWDASKHPRGGFSQNRGWFSSTAGAAGSEGRPTFLDAVIRRNDEIAYATGITTRQMLGSSQLARTLKDAARLPDDAIRVSKDVGGAGLKGLGTGEKRS